MKLMRTPRTGTLKRAFVGFAAVLTLAGWAIALLVADADVDHETGQAEARASNLALVFEEQFYRQILSIDQTLRVLKSDWERNPASFDYSALRRRALAVSGLVSHITILDGRGRIAGSTRPRDGTEPDLSGRRFFQEHRSDSAQTLLVTGPFQSNGKWSLEVSRRLNIDHGSFGGVVCAAFDLKALTRDMAQADLGPRGMIMLVGRDGLVRAISLSGVEDPGADIKGTPLYRAMFDSTDRVWTGPSGPDGNVRIDAWQRVPGQDMVLVVGLDRAAALMGAHTRQWEMLLGAGALTLLVMVITGAIAGGIASAAKREQQLAAGQAVLEAANARLAAARVQADEKSMQLGMTLAGMSDGVSMFDADLKLVQWNDRFADLTGIPRAALRIGLPVTDVLRIQADAGEFGDTDPEAEIARQLAIIRDTTEPTVLVRLRPDGSVTELRRTRLPDGGWVTLYTDITTRKQVEDAQSRAREQAEVAAQEKSRFVAIVSHEIRTPLNVALSSLALLERSDLGAAQHQLVSTGLLAGESLMGLLNDILDLSRMQVGRMELRPAPFVLRPMLNAIVEMFRAQAEERGVVLSVAVSPDVPERLITDAGRLRQALTNLVNNAAKFATPGAASVRVGPAMLGGRPVLRFAVRDGGPDIPGPDRATLFRPFSQLHQPGDTGTGLGLAICQLLANLLGGHIGCDALPQGKEFWLTIPAAAMQAPDAPQATGPAVPRWLPRTRVLLVEDIPANQLVVATLLRRAGHMVDVASSGPEALQKVAAGAYDMALLDIFMPGMDGLETARRIRALPGPAAALPIVALTANVSDEDSAAYQAAGLDGLVPKPIEDATLLDAMARHVWGTGQPDHGAAPAPPLAAPSVIDVQRVRSWQGGLRPAVSDGLFAECLRELRNKVPVLQDALTADHAPAIGQATHAMIGVAANYGLCALEAAIRSVAAAPGAFGPDEQAARLLQEIDRAELAIAAIPVLEAA